MEFKQIEKLLEKYLDAETTLREEEMLRQFFQGDDVPAHLEEYRSMFVYFAESGKETLPSSAPPTRTFSITWMGAAAAVVLALGTYGFYISEQERKEAQLAEAREAYIQTRQALELLSINLDRGTQKLAYINQFEVAKSKIIRK